MIELTMKELIESIEVLQYVVDQPMRAKLAYKVSSIIEKTEQENSKFNEIRSKLIEKYGKKDENNVLIEKDGNYTIPTENIKAFNEELTELLNTPLELIAEPIDLIDIENMELTPRQILKIKKYIKKEEA